jgi:hypothetical protein
MPPWYRIVKCYPDFHNGPTVPFLLGALQTPIGALFPNEKAAKQRLRWLLDTVHQDAPSGCGVRLQWCGPTRVHVLAECSLLDGFYWDRIDGCVMPDFGGLFDKLWALYGREIVNGTYSITDGEWAAFTAEERQQIQAALNEGCEG